MLGRKSSRNTFDVLKTLMSFILRYGVNLEGICYANLQDFADTMTVSCFQHIYGLSRLEFPPEREIIQTAPNSPRCDMIIKFVRDQRLETKNSMRFGYSWNPTYICTRSIAFITIVAGHRTAKVVLRRSLALAVCAVQLGTAEPAVALDQEQQLQCKLAGYHLALWLLGFDKSKQNYV